MGISEKGKEIKAVLCKGEKAGVWKVSPCHINPASADYYNKSDNCKLIIEYDNNYAFLNRKEKWIKLRYIEITDKFFIDYLDNFIKFEDIRIDFNSILNMFYEKV